ncbi:unnamed protein product [Lecanosticta acicola]|uniref:Unnamed protein product n=1 Tax=Lecanosticta acicola TaxID=111012 RepID=A0AAI8YRU9_9PEZI|nr:unnamed protein product [Lecanosticta acicola]
MPNNPPERPKKLQRISQACDLCHRRSIRCRPSSENPQHQCQNCYDFAVDCTYNRPSRRRRNQSVPQISPPNLLPSQQQGISPSSPAVKVEGQFNDQNETAFAGLGFTDRTGAYVAVREGRPEDHLGIAWRSFASASLSPIERCLEVYMEILYPMFPFFHEPTLWSRIRRKDHLTDRGFFASIMAACALASARARDGAISTRRGLDESIEQASETFFSAAQDVIYKDLGKTMGLGYVRACALLALTSIQYGQKQSMHQFMGHYHTLSAMQHLHDEDQWPAEIPVEEREERRRLFWAMYSWDIYTSVVFDSVMRLGETHCNVRYPIEVNDEELSPNVASPPNNELNWLRGWNFTVDLYRILEHATRRLRRKKLGQREDRVSVVHLMVGDGISDERLMENVLDLYNQLPRRFKEYQVPATGDKSQDLYGFQAANIQATLLLVRITLFDANSHERSLHQKCDVAREVLHAFEQIDPTYLRALSTPLVHHIGGIGKILGSVMQGTLTEDSYQRVRGLVHQMADLLGGLESGLHPTTNVSRDLRQQIDKIDLFMSGQRQILASFPQQQQQPQQLAPNGIDHGFSNGTALLHHTNALGMSTPLDEFQLPADVVDGWPFPMDFGAVPEGQYQMPNGFSDDRQGHHHR